jgi:hypothetical protein
MRKLRWTQSEPSGTINELIKCIIDDWRIDQAVAINSPQYIGIITPPALCGNKIEFNIAEADLCHKPLSFRVQSC